MNMTMTNSEKSDILEKAKQWFLGTMAENHVKNTEKLADPNEFNINPFLTPYIANFFAGNSSSESLAKALIYPRALGTSITTSFGTNMQRFSSDVLASFGSTTAGIDVEFVDVVDGRKKYCQLKAGPNTINYEDVETIHGHFSSVLHLARTNSAGVGLGDLIVGVLYGEAGDLSGHYRRIESQYHHTVIIGKDFWHRLTGDETFYHDLVNAIAQVAESVDGVEVLEQAVKNLSESEVIQKLSRELGE